MNAPLVSVLMPVYNAGPYLRASLESVLTQTYSNLEIFVIDDGSTDGSMHTISDVGDARIRILRQDNAGKSVALNRALEHIGGAFYAIQDADDQSYPTRIERQVASLLAHPELAAVFSGYDLLIGERRFAPRFRSKAIDECRRDIDAMRMPSHDPTAMFRVSLVRDIRYAEELRVGQGWDYILRVGERHPMMVLGECLYSYRVRMESNTRQDGERRRARVEQVLKRARSRRGIRPEVPSGTQNTNRRRPARHRDREHGLVSHFMESVLDLRATHDYAKAGAVALRCAAFHPLDPYYYKPLAYLVAPRWLIRCHRQRKNRPSANTQCTDTASKSLAVHD